MEESRPVRVGDEATTASVLRPGGIIVISGQRYSARSGGEMIGEGVSVIVTSGDNLGFAVRAAASIVDRESLPSFGKVVYADFGSSKRAQAIEEERRMQQWLEARRRWTCRTGLWTGGLFASIGVGLLWKQVFEWVPLSRAVGLAIGLIAAGAVIGFLMLKVMDGFLRDVDFSLYRFSWPSLCLACAGFLAGVVLTLPNSGIGPSLLWGVAGSFLLGLPLPVTTAIIAVGAPGGGGAGITEGSRE